MNDQDGMTVVEHLEELRRRLIVSVLAVAGGTVAGWFLTPRLLPALLRPAQEAGIQMISLAPAELFWVYLKVAVLAGLVLAMPVVLYELVAFVWPGLEARERRLVLLLLPTTLALFAAGVAFAYTVMLGFMFQFFVGFRTPGVTPTLSVGHYLSFVINVILPFGFVFQLPVFVALLAVLDLVTAEFLSRNRKYAVLAIFVLAAVLTPPDPISQLVMAVPLLALYEVSVLIVRLVRPRRRARAA